VSVHTPTSSPSRASSVVIPSDWAIERARLVAVPRTVPGLERVGEGGETAGGEREGADLLVQTDRVLEEADGVVRRAEPRRQHAEEVRDGADRRVRTAQHGEPPGVRDERVVQLAGRSLVAALGCGEGEHRHRAQPARPRSGERPRENPFDLGRRFLVTAQEGEEPGRRRLEQVTGKAAGAPGEHLERRPGRLRRPSLEEHRAPERAGQRLRVGHPDPRAVEDDVVDEPLGLVVAAPHDRQHGVARRHHHQRLHVAREPRLLFERRQCRLGLAHPAELHQRHEPPEQAAALLGRVARRAGEVDDLRGRSQPVVDAAGVPQGVEAGVEDDREHAGVPRPAGPRQRFVH
jgi:hypothetical protein